MTRLTSFLRGDSAIAIAIAAFTFVVYLLTLSPSIGYEDPGEIAAAVHGLGIVHPTGYPLFSLLGRAFSILPLGDLRVIVKLNLMGAVFCSVAAGVFYPLMLVLLREIRLPPAKAKRGAQAAAEAHPGLRLAATVGALTFAFSRIYWSNAVSLEVYALHLLFLALVTLLFLRALEKPDDARTWLLFAYVLGLSFANHMMTVLLAPAFLYLFFATHGVGRPAWLRIATAAPPFALGLTPYLYLPIRAAAKPLMNWGDPSTFEGFWHHVSAAQYRTFMFSSSTVAETKFGDFVSAFPGDFGYVPLLFAALGAVLLLRRAPRLPTFVLLLFVTCVIYAVNYDFEDANFHLNAHFAAAICVAWGVRGISRIVGRKTGKTWATGLILLVAAFPLGLNWKHADRSDDRAIEDFSLNILGSLDSGAIVFTGAYPIFGSASFYLQSVENVRTDVTVLQMGMLAFPWYHDYLKDTDPLLIANSRQVFADHRRLIDQEKGGTRTHGDTLARLAESNRLIQSIIRDNYATRPVYATSDLEPETQGTIFQGMVFRFFPDSVRPPPYAGPEPRFRPIKPNDPRLHYIRTYYASVYANIGILSLRAGDRAAATERLRSALALDPENAAIAARLRRLEAAR